MARARPRLTFDDLPLFAADRDIAEAVVGPDEDDQRKWCASLKSLESCGFPKPTQLYGKRYTPAVREFYERQYGLIAKDPTDSGANEGRAPWNGRASRRRV